MNTRAVRLQRALCDDRRAAFDDFFLARRTCIREREGMHSQDAAEYSRVVQHTNSLDCLCDQLASHAYDENASVVKSFANLPPAPRTGDTVMWRSTSVREAAWLPSIRQSPSVESYASSSKYEAQKHMRQRGQSQARYQHAKAGTYSAPHVDTDARNAPLHTVLQQQVGLCIVIAWKDAELGVTDMHADMLHWYDQLKSVDSLSFVLMSGACSIGLAAGTAHMVFTCQDKEQYTFHIY
jgi:hypothetical protein